MKPRRDRNGQLPRIWIHWLRAHVIANGEPLTIGRHRELVDAGFLRIVSAERWVSEWPDDDPRHTDAAWEGVEPGERVACDVDDPRALAFYAVLTDAGRAELAAHETWIEGLRKTEVGE